MFREQNKKEEFKEEKNMQATASYNMGYRANGGMVMDMDFFGSYVKNTKVIPSVKESYEERAKQREIFEIIDDYIEQA